jgi:hypothetical protein
MAKRVSNGDSATGAGETRPPHGELRELEDELCRLSGVLAVRVVGDRAGRPVEVHVLADRTKPAKQTVRDVRALAQTVFGIELDHRIVSVAQYDAAGESAAPTATTTVVAPRARVGRVGFEGNGVRAQVRVVLVMGDVEYTGYADGSVAAIAAASASG